MRILNKLFVYSIDWLIYQYQFRKNRVKLENYRKNVAKIGKNFCQSKNKLAGQGLVIFNLATRENIVIGDSVKLECKLNCNTKGKISIGDYSSIRENSVINCDAEVNIGRYCFIGNEVLIQDNDSHPISVLLRKEQSLQTTGYPTNTYEAKHEKIVIDDCVWIGTGAKILKGVTIGYGSIVGASSVVTKDVPPLSIVAGNPARVVRQLEE